MSDFKVTNFAPERGHDVFVGRVAQGAAGSGQVLVSDGVTEVDAIRLQFTGAGVTENPDHVAQVTIGTGIRTLLNNSGADVGIYQVVVNDPTADDAFRTTTTAQVTQRGIGVTQAAIVAGESGPVMFSGETPVAVTGAVVRGDFLETSATAGKATTNATRRAGSFAVLLEGADPSDLTLDLDGILIDSAVTRENTPGTSLTADYPATVPDGMAMFLALWLDSGGSTPTVSGWTRIGSTSGFRYYQRDSDSSLAGGTLAISWTGSSRSVATILVLDRLALASLVAGFAYDSTSSAAAISGLTSAQYLALAAVEAPAADVDGWTTLANENLPGDLIDVISDTSWKALRLDSDAGPINSEPAGWEDAGFDDSAWLGVDSESFAGRPGIDSALLVGPGNITIWSGLDWISRKEFTLASDALSDATLSWLVDITGHVYLDGTEIASLTTVNVNNFGTVHTVTVPAASLTTGTHCLGVRVHNDSGGANWNANPSHFKLELSGGAATVAGALVMKGFSGTGITSPYSGSALAKDAIFALTLAVDSLLSLPVARALLWGGDADLGDGSTGFDGIAEDLVTAETDTTKRLAPDGAGGVDWVAEASGVFPWFNVETYGAVQDGTTNDKTAVNSAIAALNAAGGGRLYFPASSDGCLVSGGGLDAITVPCKVLGDGLRSSKVLSDSTTTNLFAGSVEGVEFEHLELANTSGTPTAGAAIATTGSTLDRFENLYITGFYTGIDIEDSLLWTGDHLYIEAFRKYGIRIRNTAVPDAGDWALANSTFSSAHAADACIRIESSGGGKISNYKINSGGTAGNRPVKGIDLAVGTGVATAILLLTNGSIENVDGDAISLVNTGSGTFQTILIRQLEVLLPNNTGRAVNASGSGISLIDIDGVVASTTGTGREAIALTNVGAASIGLVRIPAGFTAIYVNSGVTSFVDRTGSVGNSVKIAGTPNSGDVPIASGSGDAAWGVFTTASKSFALTGVISPTQLSANTDNWAPTGLSTAAIIRASTDASRNLTGLTGGSSGRLIILANVGANDLVLKHDVTSTAANRFYCPNDTDLTVQKDTTVILEYDSTSSRWRVIGGSAASGSTSFGTPAIAYGTPAAGAASTAIRTDATIAKPTAADVDFSADVTTNNATTGHHGLLLKLDGTATHYMDGSGSWSTPGVSASGLQSGTSFPGSPATNDLYFRTDLGRIFFYDGTRWLSTDTFEVFGSVNAISAQTDVYLPMLGVSNGLWLIDVRWSYQVNTTHSSTQFWTCTFFDTSGFGGAVLTSDKSTVGSFVTPTPTAVGALFPGGASRGAILRYGKTSTPGTLLAGAAARYRIVG